MKNMFICKRDDGHNNFIFIPKGNCTGETYSVTSWNCNNQAPIDLNFFSDSYIKPDGCSHFYFKGESFPDEEDSYYHICGWESYLTFLQGMLFTNICTMKLNENSNSEEVLEINNLWQQHFSDYTVEEVGLDYLEYMAYYQITGEIKQ